MPGVAIDLNVNRTGDADMNKLKALLGLSFIVFSTGAFAQVSENEIELLRQQVEILTNRLDKLEKQNQQLVQTVEKSSQQVVAIPQPATEEHIEKVVEEKVDEKMSAVSWAERIRWSGDFRYRY